MMAQIQALTNTVATLLRAITVAAKENLNPNAGGHEVSGNGGGGSGGGGNSGGGNSRGHTFQFTHNMGR
jgi:hypothetical protein